MSDDLSKSQIGFDQLIIACCWNGKEDSTARKIEAWTDAKVFIPRLIRRIIPRNRKSRFVIESARPLYPGYLFIGLGLANDWRDIRHIPFVTHIFKKSFDEPYFVPSKSVNMIVRKEEGEFPFVDGDIVEITEGPFQGRKGTIQNGRVEIVLFERKVHLALPSSMLIRP